MGDLIRYSGSAFLQSRTARETGRALERIHAGQAITTARQHAKIDVIAETAEAALVATANLSAIEALLVSRTPHAEARLTHIADIGALSLAEVVLKAKREVS